MYKVGISLSRLVLLPIGRFRSMLAHDITSVKVIILKISGKTIALYHYLNLR